MRSGCEWLIDDCKRSAEIDLSHEFPPEQREAQIDQAWKFWLKKRVVCFFQRYHLFCCWFCSAVLSLLYSQKTFVFLLLDCRGVASSKIWKQYRKLLTHDIDDVLWNNIQDHRVGVNWHAGCSEKHLSKILIETKLQPDSTKKYEEYVLVYNCSSSCSVWSIWDFTWAFPCWFSLISFHTCWYFVVSPGSVLPTSCKRRSVWGMHLTGRFGMVGMQSRLESTGCFSWVHPNSPSCLTECLVLLCFIDYFYTMTMTVYCQSITPLWLFGPMEWTHKFLRKSHLKYLKATRELPQHWRCIFVIFALQIYFRRPTMNAMKTMLLTPGFNFWNGLGLVQIEILGPSRQLNWNHEVGNIFKSTIRGPWSRPEGWTLHDSNWMSSANAVAISICGTFGRFMMFLHHSFVPIFRVFLLW